MDEDGQNRLLHKEVTRKEFLQYGAGALIALFGLTNLLTLLGKHPKLPRLDGGNGAIDGRRGFGSSKFGA